MKKPKKITIKPFLNDKLEAVEASIHDSEGEIRVENQYPLYYMVIFNRNNTKFKSRLGIYYTKIEDVSASMIEFESITIEKILRYQISIKGDKVDLKGLGNAFNLLSQDLLGSIEKYLKSKLKHIAMQSDSYLSSMINFDDWRNPFPKYYEIVMTLFKNAPSLIQEDFKREIKAYDIYNIIYAQLKKKNPKRNLGLPTIIDWINGEHRHYLINKIDNAKDVKQVIDLIDKAVERTSKWLD